MQYLKFKIKDMFTVAVKGQIPPNQIVKWQLKFVSIRQLNNLGKYVYTAKKICNN